MKSNATVPASSSCVMRVIGLPMKYVPRTLRLYTSAAGRELSVSESRLL